MTTTPWEQAQLYAVDIIGDLNAGAEGWIEWNVLLDQTGGPTCIGTTGGHDCTPEVGHCDALATRRSSPTSTSRSSSTATRTT